MSPYKGVRVSRFQHVAGAPLSKVGQLRAAAIFLVAGLLALVLPHVGGHYIHGLVSLMAFCCIAPAWYEWQAGRLDVFETVHVIGVLYLLYFGFGALWALNDPVQATFDIYLEPFLPTAALYCLLGYLALLGGYFGPWFRSGVKRTWAERPRGALFVVLPGVLGLMGGFAAAVWSYGRWLGASFPMILSSLAQFSPLFLFSWALCWILVFSGRATRTQKWAAWGFFVPGAVALALASLTDKSLAMTLAGIPLLSLWYAKRKIPWKSLVVLLLLLVFVVFPFYNTFRVLDPRIPWKGRVAVTAEIIRGWDVEQYLDHSISAVKRRLALANSVAVVIRDVPRWVPYAQGQTLFLPTIAFFIPRVLWPDKPAFTMGRTFAETFRVVHILDQDTRIAVTVPGELYWNFDLPGVVIGMALWGLALRFLYRRYGESRFRDPVRHAIHIVLLIQFVHFGGGLAAQTVIVLRTLVMLEVLRWLGRRAGLLEIAPVAGSGPGADERPAPSPVALSR
jgi:hypothetical protein